MFRKRALIAAMSAVLLSWSAVRSEEAAHSVLTVGDAPPALAMAKFIKGEPVTKFEEGKIYIVEFWATWCGPCKQSIPHITELQAKYPDIIFIGQDVLERDDTLPEPFVKQMGDKMNYRVAIDDKTKDKDGIMVTTWLNAAHQNGIPVSFVIDKDSKIAWIGHPLKLAEILPSVIDGTFDRAKAKATNAADERSINIRRAEAAKKYEEQHPGATAALEKFVKAIEAKDLAAMAVARKELMAADVNRGCAVAGSEIMSAIQWDQKDVARASARELFAVKNVAPYYLNEVAEAFARAKDATADDFAIAQEALDLSAKNAGAGGTAALDSQALLHACKGEWDKAVEVGQKAVDAAKTQAVKSRTEKRLTSYKNKEIPAK